MITSRVAWRSLRVIALGSGASYVAVLVWPDLAAAVETMAEGLFWSVPFVLATSLAAFNNTLRIFDRIEEVVQGDLDNLTPHEYDYLKETIKSTETVTASLLVNSLIVILAGIAYFIVRGFLSVPTPGWLPAEIEVLRPDLAGIAVLFGLGFLATRILVVQFRTIPPMVAFYRFFTVDRHLPPDAAENRKADRVGASEKSSSGS